MEMLIILFIILVLISLLYYFIVQEERFTIGSKKPIIKEKIDIKNRRIVVSLTTSPLRVANMENMLNQIENQTVKPDAIYLNIPHYFKRNCEKYDEDLLKKIEKNHPLVIINRVEDVGPITKILGALKLETDPSTLFIIIDDDEGYENILIEKLVEQFIKDPTVALCNDVGKYVSMPGVDTPGVYAGFIFSRGMIEDDIYTYIENTNLYKHCYNSDDYIIGKYFNSKNIRIKQPLVLTKNTELDYSRGSDALKVQDNIFHNKRYELCKKYIDSML